MLFVVCCCCWITKQWVNSVSAGDWYDCCGKRVINFCSNVWTCSFCGGKANLCEMFGLYCVESMNKQQWMNKLWSLCCVALRCLCLSSCASPGYVDLSDVLSRMTQVLLDCTIVVDWICWTKDVFSVLFSPVRSCCELCDARCYLVSWYSVGWAMS